MGFSNIKWRSISVAAVICFAIPLRSASADIFVLRGKRGVVTFTNRQPSESAKYTVFKPSKVAFSYWHRRRGGFRPVPMTSEWDTFISQTAKSAELEPALVKAVVHVESAFNAKAKSYAGAMGLMQLMPATAKRFGCLLPYHPEHNITGGTKYLKFLWQRYSGDERLVLAAYNAGEGAVDEYNGVPPYSETQTYVKRVLAMRELYRCVESGSKSCTKDKRYYY